MAVSSVSKAAKTKQSAAIKAAEKRGAARIVKIVERTGSPKVREFKRVIVAAERLYKRKPAELAEFYAMTERVLLSLQQREREKRAQAIESLGRGLSNLADVRDLLKRMERGQNEPFCVETNATFARATLADAGVSLEQSLLDLDLLERMQSGYFLETHFEKPEAQVTA